MSETKNFKNKQFVNIVKTTKTHTHTHAQIHRISHIQITSVRFRFNIRVSFSRVKTTLRQKTYFVYTTRLGQYINFRFRQNQDTTSQCSHRGTTGLTVLYYVILF